MRVPKAIAALPRAGAISHEKKTPEESHLKFYSNLKKAKFNDNAICAYMGITMQKLMELKKLLSDSTNLEPKTV